MSKKLIINAFSGTGLYVINIIVAFVLSPLMVKTLGNINYGIWEMVIGIVGYMGILDLGLGPALLRHVAISHGKGDKQDLAETMSSAMALFLGLGIITIILFVLGSIYPEILTSNQYANSRQLKLVLIIFAANSALIFPLKLHIGVLMGLQKHHLINFSRSILLIIRAILVFQLLGKYPQHGLLTLAVLEVASNAIQFCLYSIALKYEKSIPAFSPFKCTKNKAFELFQYGIKSALFLVASRLQFASMPFIIGKAVGLEYIVYFVLPNRLVDYAKGFSLTIGFPLTPYFADMIGKDDTAALKNSWLTSSFVLQAVTLAMPFYLFFCGEVFLRLWIGNEYASAGRPVLLALLVGLLSEAFIPNARQMLMAKNQHGKLAIVSLILSICSIPLTFFCAAWMGVAGAALASSFITTVICMLCLLMTARLMHSSIGEYFLKTVFPLSLPLLMLGLALWAAEVFLTPDSYVKLLLQVLGSTFIYCTGIWIFSIPKNMRIAFMNRILMKLGKQHRI